MVGFGGLSLPAKLAEPTGARYRLVATHPVLDMPVVKSHAHLLISLPRQAIPSPAGPYHASPRIPRPAQPYRNLPHLAAPYRAEPCLASPRFITILYSD